MAHGLGRPARRRPGRQRDLAWEREITRAWARPADVEPLIEFSDARASVHGIEIIDPGRRDFRRETLEELADARNYLIWWMREVVDGRRNGDTAATGAALTAVIRAWEALQ